MATSAPWPNFGRGVGTARPIAPKTGSSACQPNPPSATTTFSDGLPPGDQAWAGTAHRHPGVVLVEVGRRPGQPYDVTGRERDGGVGLRVVARPAAGRGDLAQRMRSARKSRVRCQARAAASAL